MSAGGIAFLAFGSPPLFDTFDRKLRRVTGGSDVHGTAIPLDIVDAVWDSEPICHGAEVVVVDGVALLSPDASRILEAADQLFLLGVDTQDGIATSAEALS